MLREVKSCGEYQCCERPCQRRIALRGTRQRPCDHSIAETKRAAGSPTTEDAAPPASLRCAASGTPSDGSQPPVHVPVLLHETVAAFSRAFSRNISETSQPRHFVDGTAGFGGHSRAILQHFPDAKLLCVDRDPEVLSIAQANLSDFHGRVSFQVGSYADLGSHLEAAGFPDEVDGILVDLGANSFHFDAARRGFSVLNDGPLDMRFNQQDPEAPTAADAVNKLSEVQLTKIFKEFGEERLAKEFAKAIVRDREERGKVFETTRDLRECIERIANMWKSAGKGNSKKKKGKRASKIGSTHPATRCFQALRIYVNDELNHVQSGIKQLANRMAPNGRLGIQEYWRFTNSSRQELTVSLCCVQRVSDYRVPFAGRPADQGFLPRVGTSAVVVLVDYWS
ncbi:hypothetical protein ON010_g16254 [Phytophthora cinnamomi]|nr:hypothetical protein ON010_g16254 [Phytophthora cinnamomi]